MSQPISNERRLANYRRQSNRKNLTARQRRRMTKKENVIQHRRPARS